MKRLLLLALLSIAVLCREPFQVIFEWKSIDFQWPTDELRKQAVVFNQYIPANNFLTTVKFWKDKMYLAIPRWKDGVPVTLGVASAKPVNGVTAPLLEPFPDWDMQKLGDCWAFQLVHSMEIDPKGRMWVLDTGRATSLRQINKDDCPPRLVIFDLEDNNKTLHIYEFPDHVARRGVTYLNDIVLDHENGGMAYITDNGRDPGIIVYSVKNNTSWKIRHDSMQAEKEAIRFKVAETPVITPMHVNGIAISPASDRDRQIYYSPLSSFHLYSIPVSAVRKNVANIDQYVKELGRLSSQTDAMTMSATGVLYFGFLADDAIGTWDTKNTSYFTIGKRIMWRDHVLMQWPDSFAFDEDGNFWCVTNRFQNFLNNRVNIDVINYRFIQIPVGVKSYQYYENGTAPEWPDFNASAVPVKFRLVILLAAIFVFVAK